MDTDKVVSIFQNEFLSIADKFIVFNMSISEAEKIEAVHVWKPGVYVFWNPTLNVIKVGRHLVNSRMRAFQHIKDNTGGTMAGLRNDLDARLILFNVKDPKDKHWVAAVEIFLEGVLDPKIKAGRLG
jgi:hypothetical protein